MDNRELYHRLGGYVRPHWWRIVLSILASWGVAATDGAMAKLVQPFVDRLIVAGDKEMAMLAPLIILVLQCAKAVFRYGQEYFVKTAGQLAIQSIRNRLFDHALKLSMRFYARNPSGVLMSKVMNDVGVLQSSMGEVLVGLMRDAMTLVALIGVAFYTDWKMAGIAFLALPLAGWPAAAMGRKIKRHARRGQGILGELTSTLQQAFNGIKVIKAFGSEERESERFSRENLTLYGSLRKVLKYDAATAPFMEVLAGIGAAAVVWFGMQRVVAGEMTAGELFSVVAAIMLMYTPFKRLTRLNNYLQQAASAAERVLEVLDEQNEIVDTPEAKNVGRLRGEVVFDQVRFAYDDKPVLNGLSFSGKEGEVIALVGPSGAGKSTIAALLSRFYDPDAGSIRIDGIDLKTMTLAGLKQNLAMVDQETFLFNDTIANNIRYGRPEATDAEVREAACSAFADEFIMDLDKGYETSIGDRGLRLSGGQRQRLCIARALLRDAPILILDEATSALDTESESMVQKALTNLMQGRTTLVIAHRLSTIMHADRILVINEGEVAEEGRHAALLAHDGLYRKLHDMQFKDRG